MSGPPGLLVGRLVELWRYPVKSMAGEPLDACAVSWSGLAGDRRWALVQDGHEADGFPWLTAREVPELLRHRPHLLDPERPDASGVRVRTPDGDELGLLDPALVGRLGRGARVMRESRGIFDAQPLSLITTGSVATIAGRTGVEPSAVRFRPNLVVDAGTEPFLEDAWVGRTLRVGDAVRVRVDRRDQRCVMITLDPVTATPARAVLRTVARERSNCLGVYGSTVFPGTVARGDPVVLED